MTAVKWTYVGRGKRQPPAWPSTTVVTCVEAGVLEPMAVRMIDSLRRFGGRFADAEVLVVTPRSGAPIAAETSRRFDELGAHHVQARQRTPYTWYHFLNKAIATIVAEEQATTDNIAWVDGDVIFLKEPDGLDLASGYDFAANASDAGVIGTKGESDQNNPFWVRCAELVGLGIDQVPWVDTADGHRVRFYLNGGVYLYRRTKRYRREFLVDFERFLTNRVARSHGHVHFGEQAMLGLSVLRQGLRWQPLAPELNYPVTRYMPETFDPVRIGPVSVLHYHDSMEPHSWERLLTLLKGAHPRVHEWLAPQGPVSDPTNPLWRGVREGLRIARGFQRRAYYRRCGFSMSKPAAG